MAKKGFLEGLVGNVIPSGDQLTQAVKTVAPPLLVTGAGLAGLKHLVSQLAQQRAENEQKARRDLLVVPVPAKTAGMAGSILQNLYKRFAGAAVGAAGHPIVDAASRLGSNVKNIATELGGGILDHPKAVPALVGVGTTAAAGAGLAEMLPDPAQVASPNPIWHDGLLTLAGLGSLGVGYGAVDHVLGNRRKQQLNDRLDAAKNQYSHLLGQSLASSGKTASPDESFPVLQGFCARLAEEYVSADGTIPKIAAGDWLASITSSPSVPAVLAALLAHRFIYNRMNDVDKMHQYEKPKPPKQIQLVTAPPVPSLPAPAREEEKVAVSAEEILPMQGGLTRLADILPHAASWNANRAGRATAMAEEDIPFTVRHPFGTSVAGGLVGSLTGGAAGASIANMMGAQNNQQLGTGVGIGASAGGLLGLVLTNVLRRKRMHEISDRFDQIGPIKEVATKTHPVRNVLLPYSGWHHKGEVDTARFLSGKTEQSPHFDNKTTIGNVLSGTPYVGAIAAPFAAATEGFRADSSLRSDKKAAGIEEIAGAGALASMLGGGGGPKDEKEPVAQAVPRMVDHNTSEIETPQGNIGVTATDPQTAKILQESTGRLAKILASVQTQNI